MAVEIVLPHEIIVEILSMLPAKSLLRCQLVCKAWLNLISSTKFKVMHLHNFNQLNPRYFVRGFDYFDCKEWYNVHLDDEAFTLDPDTHVESPPYNITGVFKITGCCNGVVCLYDDDDNLYASSSDMVILWNPSIRRKLTLNLHSIEFKKTFVVLGFGYDKLSDDYKVVSLAYNGFHLARPQVEVYTAKTGIWRKLIFPDNLLCYFTDRSWSRVFFNGCVHWIAFDPTPGDAHNSIMTLDITTELFGEILLPDDLVKEELSTMMISVVGESLAVTYYNYLINMAGVTSSTYKIWVMKEYNNPTSWTLIFNMHYPDMDMGRPLQIRNKGDMIIQRRDGNMIVYNYSGYASCIFLGYEYDMHFRSYVDKYQESLALLDVGHSVSNDEGFDDD